MHALDESVDRKIPKMIYIHSSNDIMSMHVEFYRIYLWTATVTLMTLKVCNLFRC